MLIHAIDTRYRADMTNREEPEKSEEQLDNEAVDRFDGESLATEPELDTERRDHVETPDGSVLRNPANYIVASIVACAVAVFLLRKKLPFPWRSERTKRTRRQRFIERLKGCTCFPLWNRK